MHDAAHTVGHAAHVVGHGFGHVVHYHHPVYNTHQPHKAHHVHHPATKLWVATVILLALVVIFGFVTVFIPWAVKDIAVQQRAWAYPFKTCIEDTFSTVNAESCLDNDFIEPDGGVPLTGESAKCKGFILATIAFVFISVLVGVITLLLLAYILEHLWWSPFKVAVAADILLLIVCVACFLTWIMFICYMEAVCAENSIFPISPGYSYGFIMYLFATVFSIGSVFTGVWATVRVWKYREIERQEKLVYADGMEMLPQQQFYPRPVTAGTPMWTVPPSPVPRPMPVMQLPYIPASPYATVTANPGVRMMVM